MMTKKLARMIVSSIGVAMAMVLSAFADIVEGYLPVDYIEKQGSQYIDSGVRPDGNTTLEMKFWSPVLTQNCYIYGALKAWMDCSFANYIGKDTGTFNVVDGSQYYSGLKRTSTQVCVIRHTPTSFSCNGTTLKSWTAKAFETPTNLLLLAMQTPNGVSKHDMAANGTRLYSAKIWDGTTLVRDLVPVVRSVDGVLGLYDLVGGGFYPSANVDDCGFVGGFENVAKVDVTNLDRPQTSVALLASATGADAFKWTRRSLSGEIATVAESAEWTPTAADLEHWIEVVAISNGLAIGKQEFYLSKLPVVYLNTDSGAAIADKVNYVPGTMRVQGNAEFAQQYNGKIEVKGRGNSSWGFPQKPYKLKLDKKTDMFGFGKNKHWVLISDYVDNSFMRNKHGSELAKELGVLGMDMTWVTVILNGEYYGVEMFAEHIRMDQNRVNVFDWESKAEEIADGLFDAVSKTTGWTDDDRSALEEAMSSNFSWISSSNVVYKGTKYWLKDYGLWEKWDLSGGYLYEMDGRWDETSKFQTNQKLTKINVSKPEFAKTDTSMMTAIKKKWNDFEDAFLSVDHYHSDGVTPLADVANIDSMVGYWLTLECLGNVDSRAFSRFSFVDVGGKLTMGPVWDFDYGGGSIAVATTEYGDVAQPEHWAICCFGNAATGTYPGSDFYCEWLDDPFFALKAYEMYWKKVRPWFAAELAAGGGLDRKVTYLTEAGNAHDTKFKRWGFNGANGDVAKYRQYLTTRLAWLDKQFATVNGLMASVRNETSAHPYDKRDDIVRFSLDGGTPTNVVCNTDFAVETTGGQFGMSALITSEVAEKVDWYLNGLKCRSGVVMDGSSAATFDIEGVQVAATNRHLVSVIVRDGAENVIARNYATVMVTRPASQPTQRTLTGELPQGTNLVLTAAETVILDGVTLGGPLVFEGNWPVTLELAGGGGGKNAAVQICAESSVCFSGSGELTISGSKDLIDAGGDVVISNGVVRLDFAAEEEKTSAVMMQGNYLQFGGKVVVKMSGSAQAYGFRWKDVKNVEAVVSGGKLEVSVASGEGSAAFKSNKGSNNFTLEGEGELTASLKSADARVVDMAGKVKFKGSANVEVDADAAASHARVFKSEEEISVSGEAVVVVEVNGEESEIFSSDGSIAVKGGVLCLTAHDDCLSAAGDIEISGGKLQALSFAGDAIDANGSVQISGGYVFATTCSAEHEGIDVDPAADDGAVHELKILGGTVVAVGGAGVMHAPDSCLVNLYVNSTIGTLKKYLVLTSQYADRIEKLSVNLEAGKKRNSNGFSLIAAMPNLYGEYGETDTKPSNDNPKGEKLHKKLDGIFVTTIPSALLPGAEIELSAEDEPTARTQAESLTIVLSDEDVKTGVKPEYLHVEMQPFVNGSGETRYKAIVAVNPETVASPQLRADGSQEPAIGVVPTEDGVEFEVWIDNAVMGLWYGYEVCDTLNLPFVNDVPSFSRAEGNAHKVKGSKRSSASAFYRVKVLPAKPKE